MCNKCVCMFVYTYKYIRTYLFIGPFPPQMEKFYFSGRFKNINSKTESVFSNLIFSKSERRFSQLQEFFRNPNL